jgi:ApaG protein
MVKQTTDGIQVSVKTAYQPNYSNPAHAHFVFTYEITIENKSEYSIQLLRRHWFIHESDGQVRQVEGEGVIGEQPIIEPGGFHKYVSGSNLKTNIGKMRGTYLMERIVDGSHFFVTIPDFVLIPTFKLN